MMKTNSHLFGTADAVIKMLKDGRKHLQHIAYHKSNIRETKVVVINLYYSRAIEQFEITYEEAIKLHDHTGIIENDFITEIAEELAEDKESDNTTTQADEYEDCDMIDVQAMYDDEAELDAVARYELTHSEDFESLVNNLESAAESINGAFGYVAQAVEPLINKIEDLCDPYLNMMYEMDYDWYDNYINMQADMFAAA